MVYNTKEAIQALYEIIDVLDKSKFHDTHMDIRWKLTSIRMMLEEGNKNEPCNCAVDDVFHSLRAASTHHYEWMDKNKK